MRRAGVAGGDGGDGIGDAGARPRRRGRRRGRRRRSPRRGGSPPRRGSMTAARSRASAASGRRKPSTSLVREHAADEVQRPRRQARAAPRRAPRRRPGCGRRRARARRRRRPRPAGRGAGAGAGPAIRRLRDRGGAGGLVGAERAQARRARCRRSPPDARRSAAGGGRSSRPASSRKAMRPCSSQTCQSRLATASGGADRLGAGLDLGERLGRLPADDAGDAALQDAGLLARRSRRGCRRGSRWWSSDTGVTTVSRGRSTTLVASSRPPRPTSSRHQSAGVSAMARKAAAVVISKKVIGARAVRGLAALEQRGERVLVDQAAGEADALVEAGEVRRGVDVDAGAAGLEAGAQRGDDRALAVGAGDVDDRRQPALGMAERGEEPLDAAEREVDDLGVQRRQPVEDARRCPGAHCAAWAASSTGAGSSPCT